MVGRIALNPPSHSTIRLFDHFDNAKAAGMRPMRLRPHAPSELVQNCIVRVFRFACAPDAVLRQTRRVVRAQMRRAHLCGFRVSHSTIRPFDHSTIRLFDYSTIRPFLLSALLRLARGIVYNIRRLGEVGGSLP